MRILCLIDTLEVGGTEKSMLDILARLKETEVVLCHLYPGETLKPEFVAAGVEVISLNLRGRYSLLQGVRRVGQAARDTRCDLIHSSLFRAGVVGRIAGHRLRLPVVHSFVSESYAPARLTSMSQVRRLKLRAVQEVDRATARWCEHFTANSQSVRTSVIAALGISPGKISVIYRGREPLQFIRPADSVVQGARRNLGSADEDIILLNVGRLTASKGQADLVRAMPAVVQTHPEVRLLIAGEGPFRSELERAAGAVGIEGSVRLLGERDDVPSLLHCADLFVFPSHYEGNPGALIEAMLAGRPIVASDIPAHREIVRPGETGLLAASRDPQALAEAIRWAINHREEMAMMGERARLFALEYFDINRVAEQFERLCQETVAQWRAAQ